MAITAGGKLDSYWLCMMNPRKVVGVRGFGGSLGIIRDDYRALCTGSYDVFSTMFSGMVQGYDDNTVFSAFGLSFQGFRV